MDCAPLQVAVWHGMADQDRFFTHLCKDPVNLSAGLRFSAPGPDGTDGDDFFVRFQHGVGGCDHYEVGSRGIDHGPLVHHFRVADIAVGKGNQVDLVFSDQIDNIRFRMDGDPIGIKATSKIRGITPVFDIGDLGRSKGNNIVSYVVSEINIEIVKVASGGSHDDHVFFHGCPSWVSIQCCIIAGCVGFRQTNTKW